MEAGLEKNQIHTVRIEGYAEGGMGVARIDGRVVFVHGALRGERVRALILKAGRNAAFAKALEVLEPSAARQDPDCPYFPRCGGCTYRHMTYGEELWLKRQRVQDALARIGGSDVEVEGILGAEEILRYRNKAQYPASADGAVGFYRARTHEVVDCERCLLVHPAAEAAANALRRWMAEYGVSGYDGSTGKGIVRHLFVRNNTQGEVLVGIAANAEALPREAELIAALREACPDTVGIVLNTNTKRTNVIFGPLWRTLWGGDRLEDTLCGLRFRLSAPSFYQINHAQCERLYAKAVEFAQFKGDETLLDLYCGAGAIALTMARHAKRVVGAELVPEAIDDARGNAKRNRIENAEFLCGDASETALQLERRGLRPDVVTVDPPRKGLAEDVVRTIARMSPRRVVYVSCDSATLARDVKRFAEAGYAAVHAAAVDMFPRADHVETCVLLSRGTYPQSIEVKVNIADGEVTKQPTYKRIQEYIESKYGFKVHTAYIAEVKRMHGLDMHDAPNAVEQRKYEPCPCPQYKIEAIEEAFQHFGMI